MASRPARSAPDADATKGRQQPPGPTGAQRAGPAGAQPADDGKKAAAATTKAAAKGKTRAGAKGGAAGKSRSMVPALLAALAGAALMIGVGGFVLFRDRLPQMTADNAATSAEQLGPGRWEDADVDRATRLGHELKMGNFLAEPLLLVFWSVHDPLSIENLGKLVELQLTRGLERFSIVPIVIDGSRRRARQILKDHEMARVVIYHDVTGELARQFSVEETPIAIIASARGRELVRFDDPEDWESGAAVTSIAAQLP